MKKKQMIERLAAMDVRYAKSWNKSKLRKSLNKNAHKMSVYVKVENSNPRGNWNTAKDWFPTIEIDQATRRVDVTRYESSGYQKKASVETESIETEMNEKGDSLYVRGSVDVRNWSHGECSGSQNFCFAIFVGDSGHIYTHRAPASAGWMEGDPENIRKRLRKLGIGATENVVQQGDFLLKPANGNACADDDFAHETKGAGHHNFEMPVLYAFDGKNRQYKITEPTRLIHTAVDGIQHPTVIIPVGIWVVGATASSLNHVNVTGD